MSEHSESTANLAVIDRELAALSAHSRALQAWLCRRLACGNLDRAALVRYFGALSLATTRLSTILVRRAAVQGPEEIEHFFEEISRLVWESENQADPSGLGPPLPPPP